MKKSIKDLFTSFDADWKFDLFTAESRLDELFESFSVVAKLGVDFNIALSLHLDPCVLDPLQVKVSQELLSTGWGIVSLSVLDWGKLILSHGLEQPELFSLLENVKVEEFELDSVVGFWPDRLILFLVEEFDLLFSKVVAK
jgi:hypothetical protein